MTMESNERDRALVRRGMVDVYSVLVTLISFLLCVCNTKAWEQVQVSVQHTAWMEILHGGLIILCGVCGTLLWGAVATHWLQDMQSTQTKVKELNALGGPPRNSGPPYMRFSYFE